MNHILYSVNKPAYVISAASARTVARIHLHARVNEDAQTYHFHAHSHRLISRFY